MMMCKPANRALIEGPEIVRQVQMVALENLCEFDRICKKHGIPYILMAGTLLGAIRHKGFIPWDDDIDVAMLEDDWLRYSETIEKELEGRPRALCMCPPGACRPPCASDRGSVCI